MIFLILSYEAMGFDEFKIIDRSRSTAWLLRAAKAYTDRYYEGNLLDILSFEMLGDPAQFQSMCSSFRHAALSEQEFGGFQPWAPPPP